MISIKHGGMILEFNPTSRNCNYCNGSNVFSLVNTANEMDACADCGAHYYTNIPSVFDYDDDTCKSLLNTAIQQHAK